MNSARRNQVRWLAVVELSLFLTRAWADFLFPDKKLPHARELVLVGGVIFIWDLRDKPLTETGISHVIGMPRANAQFGIWASPIALSYSISP